VQLAAQGQDILFNFVENLKIPVIAAVNGFALGGLELAMACHFTSDNARMEPEVSLGVIPDMEERNVCLN
jgi:enoyl-CoA hydratase